MQTTVTQEELEKFILDQPPERKINFCQNHYNDSCGCLFIHYARHFGFNQPVASITRAKNNEDGKLLIFDVPFYHWKDNHEEYKTLQEQVLRNRK